MQVANRPGKMATMASMQVVPTTCLLTQGLVLGMGFKDLTNVGGLLRLEGVPARLKAIFKLQLLYEHSLVARRRSGAEVFLVG